MPAPRSTVPTGYFDALYRSECDPWGLTTSKYEKDKRDFVLEHLPQDRYKHAYEPACATGSLTRSLAARCDYVTAGDAAASAVEAARFRTRGMPNVRVALESLPGDMPAGPFDLVVLSEFLYYFSLEDLDIVLERLSRLVGVGADIVCVHRRTMNPEHWDGASVHAYVQARTGWDRMAWPAGSDCFAFDIFRA